MHDQVVAHVPSRVDPFPSSPLEQVAGYVNMIARTQVSEDRFLKFLEEEERTGEQVPPPSSMTTDLVMKLATFSWVGAEKANEVAEKAKVCFK